MTSTDLEDAAFTPYRFQWGLETRSDIQNLRQYALNLWLRGDTRYFHDQPPEDATQDEIDLRVYCDFTPAVVCLEFVPGGRFFVSGSESGYLRLWDLEQRTFSEVSPYEITGSSGLIDACRVCVFLQVWQNPRAIWNISIGDS